MMTFTPDDIRRIAEIFGTEAQENENEYFFSLTNPVTKQSLTLNLCNEVDLGDGATGALVIAQTQHGYFEVHDCTAFMVFEPDELIFLSADDERISGMVVGKQCTCSMFVNVQRKNLSANFADLDPRLLMSAMQLSVAEVMLLAE
jgi:hypothetical protein